MEGSIAALSDTISAALVTTSYTPNFATDDFYDDIPGGAITAALEALTGKSGAAGTLSASNLVWTSVSGSASAYIVLAKDTTVASTSQLIGLIDTATGLPVTPNGGDITVAWASGQVFTLFEGLPEREKGKLKTMRDWLREVCRIPAVLGPGGIWIPKPQIVLA